MLSSTSRHPIVNRVRKSARRVADLREIDTQQTLPQRDVIGQEERHHEHADMKQIRDDRKEFRPGNQMPHRHDPAGRLAQESFATARCCRRRPLPVTSEYTWISTSRASPRIMIRKVKANKRTFCEVNPLFHAAA